MAITQETAFDHIQGLIARNDLATAEKLIEKHGPGLPKSQRRELEALLEDRRRELRRDGLLREFSRRPAGRFLRLHGQWLWLLLLLPAVWGYLCLFPLAGRAVRYVSGLEGPLRLLRLLPLGLYLFLPPAGLFTWRYLQALYLWTTGRPRSELMEVAEVQSRTAFFRSRYRYDEKHYYQVSSAVLRPVDPAPWSLLERRVRFNGEGRLGFWAPPWPEREAPFLHVGDRVTMYYDRRGIRSSLFRHTRRSLTLDWLKALGWLAGLIALAALAVPLLSLLGVWLRRFF